MPVIYITHCCYHAEINLCVVFLGGGPPKPKTEDPLQERILSLITPSAVGLQNPYDSDGVNIEEPLDGSHLNLLASTQNRNG